MNILMEYGKKFDFAYEEIYKTTYDTFVFNVKNYQVYRSNATKYANVQYSMPSVYAKFMKEKFSEPDKLFKIEKSKIFLKEIEEKDYKENIHIKVANDITKKNIEDKQEALLERENYLVFLGKTSSQFLYEYETCKMVINEMFEKGAKEHDFKSAVTNFFDMQIKIWSNENSGKDLVQTGIATALNKYLCKKEHA